MMVRGTDASLPVNTSRTNDWSILSWSEAAGAL
jgi:hypothetical protein